MNRTGAFAEYISVPMTNVWHHREGVDEEVASIFDPFGNAVHTALAFECMGEDVLITGAGPHRHHGDPGCEARGRTSCRHHRCE